MDSRMVFQGKAKITSLADGSLESQCLPDSATNVLNPEVSRYVLYLLCLLCLNTAAGR
ncbi:hypothetical protein N9383_00500 [Granulosicoccus sp.]|nr:hypothetical protein [Granulosicoccus sp.]